MTNIRILFQGAYVRIAAVCALATALQLSAAERPFVFTYMPQGLADALTFRFGTRESNLVFLAGELACYGNSIALQIRTYSVETQMEGDDWVMAKSRAVISQPSIQMMGFYQGPYERSLATAIPKDEMRDRLREALEQRDKGGWIGEFKVRISIDIFVFDYDRRQFVVAQSIACDPFIICWEKTNYSVVAYNEDSFLGANTSLFRRIEDESRAAGCSGE